MKNKKLIITGGNLTIGSENKEDITLISKSKVTSTIAATLGSLNILSGTILCNDSYSIAGDTELYSTDAIYTTSADSITISGGRIKGAISKNFDSRTSIDITGGKFSQEPKPIDGSSYIHTGYSIWESEKW